MTAITGSSMINYHVEHCYIQVQQEVDHVVIYLIQNTFGVKKARPSKVESYLEVNT